MTAVGAPSAAGAVPLRVTAQSCRPLPSSYGPYLGAGLTTVDQTLAGPAGRHRQSGTDGASAPRRRTQLRRGSARPRQAPCQPSSWATSMPPTSTAASSAWSGEAGPTPPAVASAAGRRPGRPTDGGCPGSSASTTSWSGPGSPSSRGGPAEHEGATTDLSALCWCCLPPREPAGRRLRRRPRSSFASAPARARRREGTPNGVI